MCDPTEEQEAEFQKNKQITIRKLESENEALKRERAMLVEALKRFLPRSREQRASETMNSFDNAAFVISATEIRATQWLNDKLSAAKQAGRDEVLRELSEQTPVAWVNNGGRIYGNGYAIKDGDTLIIRPSAPEKGEK